MAVQETTGVAVLATRACSPGLTKYPLYGSLLEVTDSLSEEDVDVVATDKEHRQGGGKQALKENVQLIRNGPLKTSTGKHDESQKKMIGTINRESTDDLRDIYISDEVLTQLRSQKEKEKKHTKQIRRKQAKSQRKMVKMLGLNNKEETDAINKGQPKKIVKQSVRRKSSVSVGRSQVLEHGDKFEILASRQENVGNKAENNNWMVNDENSAIMQNNVVIKHFYTSRNSSYLDNIIQPCDSMCKVSSLESCASQNYQGIQGTKGSVVKKELKKTGSSDDLDSFSNVSVKSTSSAGGDRPEISFEGYNPRSSDELKVTSANTQASTSSSVLCSACGHEPQGHGSGLCKTCIGRIKHDGVRIGALGELRAYAQSIADSVKKILSISPRQSEEVLHPPSSIETRDEGKRRALRTEIVNLTNITGAQLQKCKTQISLTHSEDARTMSLLNKSMSFDGRVAAHLDESSRCSPVYWISQDKQKLPISSSTLSEADEDKLRGTMENPSDYSVVDGDYFPSSGREIRLYKGHDDGDGNSTVERTRRKSYLKQKSCVERMRPEGDTRNSCSKLTSSGRKSVADEHRREIELQLGKGRTYRGVNAEDENIDERSKKHEEEMNALNVFRLKVIHEGSPVDPLYTVQRGKGDDYKDRRAMFLRSATAPNKNHMPKKDGSMEDKPGITRSSVKAKRVNTKLDLKTNKSPQIEEIVIEEVKDKQQLNYDGEPQSWRDDTSVMAITPFTRRRSTSYDGRRTMSTKRNDQHRSISRSVVEREEKGHLKRRHAKSTTEAATKMQHENKGGYTMENEQKIRFSKRATGDNQTDDSMHIPSSPNKGSFSGRYHALEPSNKQFSYNIDSDRIFGMPIEKEHLELLESSSKSYFNDDKYYCSQTDHQFSAGPRELILNKKNAELVTESYYCHIDQFDSQLVSGGQIFSEKALQFESEGGDSMFKLGDDEDAYHNQIKAHSANDICAGKDNQWYSSQPERRALFRRDCSHESKSGTSFHVVTRARSSHSDVALMKHPNSWEHAPSRRQTMYSETDVDTGLIYHFAKRQTNRAHVPAYNDLTSSSKDIYTMSGDVSTSASSNSAISTKSDVSESAYTGGFFTQDPFYDNGVSDISSPESPDHFYFEPNGAIKREPSEVDIYTGALFSSSQNALSLGRVTEGGSNQSTLKDGSTNNSTRPPLSRLSRRRKDRPHIDVIQFKMAESTCDVLPEPIEENSEIPACNTSNNSSSWSETDHLKDSIYQGALVKESKEPSYTEYATAAKPAFHVKSIEKAAPINLMRYDKSVIPSSSFFYSAPSHAMVGGDSIWYSGLSDNMGEETEMRHIATPEQAVVRASYSWQRNDDYYRSAQRPINKTNNCRTCEELEQPSYNTNNNRFEDLYTGFFEASSTKPCIPEQTSNVKKPSTDNWYSEKPKRNYSSPDFYDEVSSISETPKRAATTGYEATEGAYSSASVFGQASAAYSGSRTYMNQTGWRDYEKTDMSSSNSYVDESPKFSHPAPESPGVREKYSYFPYVSDKSPREASYKYDKGGYGFGQRTPSPEADLNEIRKVGGIVCRENVVNKEDYAEDVNRDLEQGGWLPFNFRHEEKTRHQEDTNINRSETFSEIMKPPVVVSHEKHAKHADESSYNQDRIYDNVGARNKWREMTVKAQPSVVKKREMSPHKAFSTGDTKRQDHIKTGAWNPPDQIPDRARGKRPTPAMPKPTVLEGSKGSTTTLNVISSVTSIPSRLTSYVRRWF